MDQHHIPPQRQPLIDEFIAWNQRINLSALRTPGEIYTKHILDSLELPHALASLSDSAPENRTLLDVGTGGGFPLLPLALTYPTWSCTGLDSTRKKLTAVQAIADVLGAKNVSTIWSRAEDHKATYDIVTARAVTYADQLLHWSLPLVKKGGLLCLYKQRTQEEDNLILTLVRDKKIELVGLHHYTLPGDEVARIIYLLRK